MDAENGFYQTVRVCLQISFSSRDKPHFFDHGLVIIGKLIKSNVREGFTPSRKSGRMSPDGKSK